jgi:choline dehydrogenase-like flavoprotein
MARQIGGASGAGGELLDVVVIGGSQAGLAMAWHLARQHLRFVVLEAGPEPGHTWRSRWDSLTLFTPAQYAALPACRFPDRRIPTRLKSWSPAASLAALPPGSPPPGPLPSSLGDRSGRTRRPENTCPPQDNGDAPSAGPLSSGGIRIRGPAAQGREASSPGPQVRLPTAVRGGGTCKLLSQAAANQAKSSTTRPAPGRPPDGGVNTAPVALQTLRWRLRTLP